MSIGHCIAGVVLVVTGGLAVNAYQEQPLLGGGPVKKGPAIDDQEIKSILT